MITINLRGCCNDCMEFKPKVKQEVLRYYGEAPKLDTTISCEHCKVCKRYIEDNAKEG